MRISISNFYSNFYNSMADLQSLTKKQAKPSPFTEIINRFAQRFQEDLCKKSTNPSNFKTVISAKQNQKQINTQSTKTIKKKKLQNKVSEKILASASTTLRNIPTKFQQNGIIPQWYTLTSNKSGEISHALRLQCPFSQATKIFIEFSKSQKLIMFQQTESFITVKKGGSGGCRCFLKIWSRSEEDTTVYQLRKFGKGHERVKLILVQGNELAFNHFYLSLVRNLEQNKLATLLPVEKVQLYFNQQNKKVVQIANKSQSIIQKLQNLKQIKSEDIQALAKDVKEENLRLKAISKQIPNLNDIPAIEKQIEDLCFANSGIKQLFQQLYRKDYKLYRQKRLKILKKFNIPELFEQLEISSHYESYKKQISLKEIEQADQKIPYMPAIRELKRFASTNSNSVALQSAVIFHQKIRQSYNKYFKNSFKMADMDDFLPTTIFCVLAVDCQRNMLGMVKMLLSQFQALDEAEWEKKTLTDIEAAFEYILKQWKIDE